MNQSEIDKRIGGVSASRMFNHRGVEIVCLCGSTRFRDEFVVVNYAFTMRGYIVLTVGAFNGSNANNELTREVKAKLDALHLVKIERSDFVYIINPEGYIGESTEREIAYAEILDKPIYFLETPQKGIKNVP